MTHEEIEAALVPALEFVTEAKKWGKHVNQPFSAVQLLAIFDAYEAKLAGLKASHEVATTLKDEAHQRYVSELTGKIGGLQKRINSLEARK